MDRVETQILTVRLEKSGVVYVPKLTHEGINILISDFPMINLNPIIALVDFETAKYDTMIFGFLNLISEYL